MNLYFIVEGKRTESIVYPAWISLLLPELKRIYDPFKVTDNQYYLFDGGGYPNILKDMIDSIYDINAIGKFDYFIVCLDADDESIHKRINQVRDKIESEGMNLSSELAIIVQKKCIETWFLGNRDMYTQHSNSSFRRYANFYNVSVNDPENMEKPPLFDESTSQFHYRYLEAMLREKGLRYSKGKPYCICKESYMRSLIDRIDNSDDLSTFRYFINFCRRINEKIKREK